MRFFKWFGQTNLSRLLINIQKYFQFLFRIHRYSTFRAFCVFSVWLTDHSAYSLYTNTLIPRILSIRTDSFRVFSEYEQQNFVRIITSFCVFSEYVQIHPRILRIRTDSFRVFSVYVQIHSAYSENAPK
jgi:hypothetical protein